MGGSTRAERAPYGGPSAMVLVGPGAAPDESPAFAGALDLLGLAGADAVAVLAPTGGGPPPSAHSGGRGGGRRAPAPPAPGPWLALRPLGDRPGAVQAEAVVPEPAPERLRPYAPLLGRLRRGLGVDDALAELVDEAVRVWARPGFESLISLPRLRFSPFPHQLSAARAALTRMRGRAILADEVGLGKTIEAGLVLSELYLRRLAERTLILVPAGLVEQWHEELDRKFALPCLVHAGPEWAAADDPWASPVVIASLATARRAPLRDLLVGMAWDLVIVDEAHRIKNAHTASARLVTMLRARHLLLLTATPVENRLDDLFQLVNLVRPGHLGAPARFRARHGRALDGAPVRDLGALQASLREVMIRHRRSELALMLPRRLAETIRVAPAADEAELYRRVSERVRSEAATAAPSRALALRSLQRLAGSSPRALVPSLRKAGWDDLARMAQAIGSTEKVRALAAVLARRRVAGGGAATPDRPDRPDGGEKAVVFTAYRETLALLAEAAQALSLPAVVYHGGLTRTEKDAAIRRFEREVPLLLTTEAAGEGRNLQFCRVMVNFDLPWNPMQIEQRLGRIHRIGQEREVLLTNLVSRGTVEDRILNVLETKINLFELVVGELDMILGRIEEDFDFESFVFSAYVTSRDDDEFGERLERLGDELSGARRAYLAERDEVDQLVGEAPPT